MRDRKRERELEGGVRESGNRVRGEGERGKRGKRRRKEIERGGGGRVGEIVKRGEKRERDGGEEAGGKEGRREGGKRENGGGEGRERAISCDYSCSDGDHHPFLLYSLT